MKDVSDPNNRSRPAGRPLLRYRDMQEFQKSKERPYIHLVDGGVSDNLGLRAILEGLEELEASPAFRNSVGLQGLRRIVVIVVNSRSAPDTDWDKGERAPGVVQPAAAVVERADRPLLLRVGRAAEGHGARLDRQARADDRASAPGWAVGGAAKASVPDIDVFAIDVSFDSIEDPKERAYFMNLPTSFVPAAPRRRPAARGRRAAAASVRRLPETAQTARSGARKLSAPARPQPSRGARCIGSTDAASRAPS